MNLDEDVYPYIKGEKFSCGLKVMFSEDNHKSIYRIELLEDLVNGKKIIHLGCLDHLPLIESKLKSNVWLHKRLTDVADLCLGIDIDKTGVEYVRNKIGFKNVIYGDIVKDSIAEIEQGNWDILVMGEVLEHIDNPIEFLEKIRLKYCGRIEDVIITVPNAFRLTNFEYANINVEFINSDHRYWFTPFTLWKVIDRAGMKLIDINLCESYRPDSQLNWRNFIRNRKITRIPLMRETIVARCSLNKE